MEKMSVGGQAVIEGVLMRSKNYAAISVNKKDGSTSVKIISLGYSKASKIPFIRGIYNLFDMLYMGTSALIWSANEQEESNETKITNTEIIVMLVFSFLLGILIFIGVPYLITSLTNTEGIIFNTTDGILRLLLFIVYIYIIGLTKDVKELFSYHGAEHKAVNCYERDEELNLENVKKQSTRHVRCGTSFILIVMVISIIMFSIFYSEHWYYNLLLRIILIPVIASVSYEILKIGDKYKSNALVRLLLKPGLMVQGLTTREPEEKHLKMAVHSLKEVLDLEKKVDG